VEDGDVITACHGISPRCERQCQRHFKVLSDAELLFWKWPADNGVGNQHVKFFLARYAVDGLVVDRTSSRHYKDMNNLFLIAMLAVNRNF
jgi:hypothetical protein